MDSVPIFMRAIRLNGIFVGSKAMFERMLKEFAPAEFRPVIDREFSFDDAPEAIRYMQKGEHFGKIVINY